MRFIFGALFGAVALLGCTVTVNVVCGDGVIEGNERCDDGNTLSGDGCSSTCQIEAPKARITANWTLRSLVSGTATTCPPGFDTAAVYNQALDASNVPIGQPIIDLFDCAVLTGTTAPLPATVYQTWVEITNHNNTMQYAQSLSAIVDVTLTDKTFNAQILVDGGYFQLAWNLVGASSSLPLTCAQAGATGGVEAISTDVANASNSASDIFRCTDKQGVTAGLLAATYSVSVAALNSNMQSVGTAPTLTNKVVRQPNKVTDLGTVSVPITGQ